MPSAGADVRTGPSPKRAHRWLEVAVVVAVALLVALLLRLSVVPTYFIPSTSMVPTLQVGDRIAANKLSYDFHDVPRRDIVVFARPADERCAEPVVRDLGKRVIGLPGETISCQAAGSW